MRPLGVIGDVEDGCPCPTGDVEGLLGIGGQHRNAGVVVDAFDELPVTDRRII